jgi:hypothetical protein
MSFTPLPLYPTGRSLLYLFNRMLNGAWISFVCYRGRESYCPLQESILNYSVVKRAAQSLWKLDVPSSLDKSVVKENLNGPVSIGMILFIYFLIIYNHLKLRNLEVLQFYKAKCSFLFFSYSQVYLRSNTVSLKNIAVSFKQTIF